MTLIRVVLAGTLFGHVGCALQGETDIAEHAAGIVLAGHAGESSPALGADPAALVPPAIDDAPCGAATVTRFETAAGTQITLCVFDDGIEAVLEAGAMGQQPVARGGELECALDVFLALAPPGLPVPPALRGGACAESAASRPIEPGAHDVATSFVGQPVDDAFMIDQSYCGPGGAASFESGRCGEVTSSCAAVGGCDLYRCIATLVGWHQLTCSVSVPGARCVYGEDVIAACGGTVRHRSWRDGNFSGPASITHDVVANTWHTIRYPYAGMELNMRFRGDRHGANASHRYCTAFRDNL